MLTELIKQQREGRIVLQKPLGRCNVKAHRRHAGLGGTTNAAFSHVTSPWAAVRADACTCVRPV